MLSPCACAIQSARELDQRLVDDGGGVDDLLVRHVRESLQVIARRPLILGGKGTAQLVVAGASIFHPDWIATPWQTCKFTCSTPPMSKTTVVPLADLIFMAVTTVTFIFVIFFNDYLPLIDVRQFRFVPLAPEINSC